tara:strand:+ start:893 stop:1141 length:249 start_codon:yes stop_codon:yes gene_type:complete
MYSPFIKYRDIFGIAGKGVHSIRLLDVAFVDYALTILLSIVFSYLTKFPLVLSTIFWLIFGIILHVLFGVKTSAIKYILNFI